MTNRRTTAVIHAVPELAEDREDSILTPRATSSTYWPLATLDGPLFLPVALAWPFGHLLETARRHPADLGLRSAADAERSSDLGDGLLLAPPCRGMSGDRRPGEGEDGSDAAVSAAQESL